MIKIVEACSEEKISYVQQLLNEYVESLGINLDFQSINKELEEFPRAYAPPEGCLLLALYNNQKVGFVCLRKLDERICEMKRMYVRPNFRGKGIGRALSRAVIDKAREKGYKRMRLDTLPSMKIAINLYYSICFKEIAPYRFNPIEGTKFMELIL